MADEFQAEVCGGNWWNLSRSMFVSSPCSSGILDLGNFGWSTDFLDMKTRSGDDQSGSANSDNSIVIQDLQKTTQSDSTLQILGIGLSSAPTTTTNWDPTLINGSCDQSNYQTILQENQNSSMNFRQERGLFDDCSTDLKTNFSTIAEEDSCTNTFKPSAGNQPINSITSASAGHVSTGFPISSISSYGYSTLLQNLFDTHEPQPQPQQSLYGNRPINYPSPTSYHNDFSPALPKFSPMPKLQNTNNLPFSTAVPNLCNGSATTLNDLRSSFFPSAQSQFLSSTTLSEKPNLPNLTAKANNDGVQGIGSLIKKTNGEPALKRPRIETPSPLPTFKVRKEKLGDRITALQQLVSPFGKTDTASVLHEAIDYIKFLHDQVNVLSTPYLKNGPPVQRQQTSDIVKDQDGSKQDLKSRGLCLVPISSTFPVAAETTSDFWTPTFGGTFK